MDMGNSRLCPFSVERKGSRILGGRSILFSLAVVSIVTAWIGVVQAQSGSITYIYDELGRLTGVVDPSGDTVTYTYDAVGNLLSISRQSSSLVSIIEFTPNSGPVGTTVTIFGTGFSATPSENSVTFNGVAATVTSSTATEIVTSVPTGATTGPIAVTTPSGSDTSSEAFTVTAGGGAPTISGFTPTIGTPGTPVTITGTNYQTTPSLNKVKFNNIAFAAVSAATATSISTSVPPGTGSGRISVTTPNGTAVSSQDFFVPPSPHTAAEVEVSGRMTIGGPGQTVTITAANNIALFVFDGNAGQGLSVSATNVTIPLSTVAVYNPNGTLLISSAVTTSGAVINVTLPTSGTYSIMVDPSGTATGSLTLALVDPADLTPTTLTAPASATTQHSISISWTVKNQGASAAQPSWTDNVYFSTDQTIDGGDSIATTATRTTALAAGATYTETKTFTIPNVPAGTYYLIVRVDEWNNVHEADEVNNMLAVPLNITTPDLTPTTLTAPASTNVPKFIFISWTATNAETGPVNPSWSDSVYLSTDQTYSADDTGLNTVTNLASLAPGASYSWNRLVYMPSVPPGDYYLILRLDVWNNKYEADEGNNEMVRPITITP